jgi:glycosyltransferase involved in cell wall biosynthesis
MTGQAQISDPVFEYARREVLGPILEKLYEIASQGGVARVLARVLGVHPSGCTQLLNEIGYEVLPPPESLSDQRESSHDQGDPPVTVVDLISAYLPAGRDTDGLLQRAYAQLSLDGVLLLEIDATPENGGREAVQRLVDQARDLGFSNLRVFPLDHRLGDMRITLGDTVRTVHRYVILASQSASEKTGQRLNELPIPAEPPTLEDALQLYFADQSALTLNAEREQKARFQEAERTRQSLASAQAEIAALRGDLAQMRAQIADLQRIKAPKLKYKSKRLRRLGRRAIPDPKEPILTGRPADLDQPELFWRIEGPIDSSYSLAIVNRELGLALDRLGHRVSFVSADAGKFQPADPIYLEAHPEITDRMELWPEPHLVSRNMYPPIVSDIADHQTSCSVAGLHCYAWEETGFPIEWVDQFNSKLRFLTVTAPHVQKVLIDRGVTVPIYVVGNGLDHLPDTAGDLPETLPPIRPDTKVFLHVSSCLPRKGVDVLLQAWAEAFDSDSNVVLIVKTTSVDDPNVDVADRIAKLQQNGKSAPIIFLDTDEPQERIAGLYDRADVAVFPARAEGFALPVAEALAYGCHVITTGWSGQTLFEGCPLLEFCDYELTLSTGHLGMSGALWAEPDVSDLVARLQAAARAPAPDPQQQAQARDWLLDRFTWDAVARRSLAAVRDAVKRPAAQAPRVAWVSTFNTRCGIATYSDHLLRWMPKDTLVLAQKTEDIVVPDHLCSHRIVRCWIEGVGDIGGLNNELRLNDIQTIVIQFNYAFFVRSALREFILQNKAQGRQIVMTLHSTNDAAVPDDRKLVAIADALQACDRIIVHSPKDLSRLRQMGIEKNVTLVPHGIMTRAELEPYSSADPFDLPARKGPEIILGSYGFFLPDKGLPELIQSVGLLRARGHDVKLRMYNTEYPQPISRQEIDKARALVRDLGLQDAVQIDTRFAEDSDTLMHLADCDCVVFPYQKSAESASGAVRYGLASARPVLITPLDVFSDIADLVHALPGTSPEQMADGIEQLIPHLRQASASGLSPELEQVQHRANDWCREHAYTRTGHRLAAMITALWNSPPDSLYDPQG